MNDEEAFRWFGEAARQGHSLAQLRLGAMLAEGAGAPKDTEEALRWIRKAAEGGLPEAQYSLGAACARGEGVPEDPVEALAWLGAAAAQGHSGAEKEQASVAGRLDEARIAQARERSIRYRKSHAPPPRDDGDRP